MITSTRSEIFNFINQNNGVRVKDLTSHFKISPQIVHRHLNRLKNEGKIRKTGKPPKVSYLPANKYTIISIEKKNKKQIRDVIDENIPESQTVITI
ncbi:winged helix-turn-helix transcriptional regulator [Candidatus Gracilibacteria bacterium]|nr:winged helix-turn-helix transcriptional regulator [Candidatus Gracilibacteria bacterium]NJS41442.1 winged helix-turn-helix transcriptional regulator [Candidatus Gracilibacteria bacterium]